MRVRLGPLLLVLGLAAAGCARDAAVPEPGRPAPPLSPIKLLQSPTERLGGWESLRGKAVVLEFWGVACVPCIDALPHLNALAGSFRERPVVFLSVTSDAEGPVEEFLKTHPMAGWVGLDPDKKVFDAFRVRGIPATFVVDPKGRIAGRSYAGVLSAADIEAALAGETFSEPTQEEKDAAARRAMTGSNEGAAAPAVLVRVGRSSAAAPGPGHSGPGLLKQEGMSLEEMLLYAHDARRGRLELEDARKAELYDVTLVAPDADDGRLRSLMLEAVKAFYPHKASRRLRPTPILELVETGKTGPGRRPPESEERMGGGGAPGSGKLKFFNVPAQWLASGLGRELGTEVVDKTGSAARFDMELSWDAKERGGLERAVSDQLGYALKRATAALEFVRIEPLKKSR